MTFWSLQLNILAMVDFRNCNRGYGCVRDEKQVELTWETPVNKVR